MNPFNRSFVHIALCAGLLLAHLPQATAQVSAEDCAQAGDREQVECLSQKIDAARHDLQEIYNAALAKMPDSDPQDRRRNKVQLTQAQTAWQSYVDANCAFVGGVEGGSNQWITNFASRCQLDATRERISFLRKEAAALQSAKASTAGPASNSPVQQVLNTLATPEPPSKTIAGLADAYSLWTEQQRSTVPRQMQGRCRIWVMMNDAGPARLLPAAQDPADTPQLTMDLCLVAHMPTDWPNRASTIRNAQRIVDRSTELGEPLSLPLALHDALPDNR
jgi:uncharacterized protein YecT (DUF1311 family)